MRARPRAGCRSARQHPPRSRSQCDRPRHDPEPGSRSGRELRLERGGSRCRRGGGRAVRRRVGEQRGRRLCVRRPDGSAPARAAAARASAVRRLPAGRSRPPTAGSSWARPSPTALVRMRAAPSCSTPRVAARRRRCPAIAPATTFGFAAAAASGGWLVGAPLDDRAGHDAGESSSWTSRRAPSSGCSRARTRTRTTTSVLEATTLGSALVVGVRATTRSRRMRASRTSSTGPLPPSATPDVPDARGAGDLFGSWVIGAGGEPILVGSAGRLHAAGAGDLRLPLLGRDLRLPREGDAGDAGRLPRRRHGPRRHPGRRARRVQSPRSALWCRVPPEAGAVLATASATTGRSATTATRPAVTAARPIAAPQRGAACRRPPRAACTDQRCDGVGTAGHRSTTATCPSAAVRRGGGSLRPVRARDPAAGCLPVTEATTRRRSPPGPVRLQLRKGRLVWHWREDRDLPDDGEPLCLLVRADGRLDRLEPAGRQGREAWLRGHGGRVGPARPGREADGVTAVAIDPDEGRCWVGEASPRRRRR